MRPDRSPAVRIKRILHAANDLIAIIVLSCALRSYIKAPLPTAFDLSGNIHRADLRHGPLPYSKAGAQAGLSATGGRAITDGSTKIGGESPNGQPFCISGSHSLLTRA